MMRAAGQEIQQEGPLQMKRDRAVFRSFRYVVDCPHPAGSSCDCLSVAGVGRFDAASSQRRPWGCVWRCGDREHLWCTNDPCAGKVYCLAGRGILCDHPHARCCLFPQGERANSSSTRAAQCCGPAGFIDDGRACGNSCANGKSRGSSFASGKSRGSGFASGKPRGDGALVAWGSSPER